MIVEETGKARGERVAGHISSTMRAVGPIQIFRLARFLTEAERKEWATDEVEKSKAILHLQRWPFHVRILNRFLKIVDSQFYVQPKPYDLLREEAVER